MSIFVREYPIFLFLKASWEIAAMLDFYGVPSGGRMVTCFSMVLPSGGRVVMFGVVLSPNDQIISEQPGWCPIEVKHKVTPTSGQNGSHSIVRGS